MISFFFKSAIRNLLQNKVYAFISITGFAVSFTVCIMIALYVKYEYNYDKCFTNYDRIYRVIDLTKDRNETHFDYEVNTLLKEKITPIEKACPLFMHTGWKNTIKYGDHTIYFNDLLCTTDSFFQIFGITDIYGKNTGFQNGTENVVITESLAKKLFPNGDAIGKSILIMDEYNLLIVSVIPDFPEHSSFLGEIIFNCENPEYRFSSACNNGICFNPSYHYILLKNNITVSQAEQKINDVLSDHQTRVKKVKLQALTDIYLDNSAIDNYNKSGNKGFINILIIIGILILVISVINYINFTNSLQYARLRIIGIQKSVGAQRKQLFFYQFTEVLLWIFISTILSFGLAYLSTPLFNKLLDIRLSFPAIFNPTILLLISIIMISVIFIASLSPVVILFKGKVAGMLKNSLSTSKKMTNKTILTSFQLIISIILLAGILIIEKQINYMKHKDLGFEKKQLLLVNTPYHFKNQEALKNELLKNANIESLSYTRGGPGKIFMSMGNGLEDNHFNLQCISVDTAFISTFGIQLAKGRKFLPSDYNKACVLNKQAYEQYGWKDLDNKRVMNGRDGGYEVIGVVNNFHIASMYESIKPVCLIYDIDHTSFLNLRLSGGNIGNTMEYIENTWKDISGNMPFEYQFYDSWFDSMYKKEEKLAGNVGFFAFIAMILTILGIFGQIFHICIIKTKEIGIRKVNGAKVSEILAWLNSNFIKWVLMAFIIAIPVAWYLTNQWLSGFAYKTSLDWWIFGTAGLVVLLVTMITISLQSWNVARRNPVVALRYE